MDFTTALCKMAYLTAALYVHGDAAAEFELVQGWKEEEEIVLNRSMVH